MAEDHIEVTFWGVRGSAPRSGENFLRYGGATSCVSVEVGSHLLILDGGSGLYDLSRTLDLMKFHRVDLCLSHGHIDHVMGLPYFQPFWQVNPQLEVHCAKEVFTHGGRGFLDEILMKPPLFPLTFDSSHHGVLIHDFSAGDNWQRERINFRTTPLNHPGGAVGYHLESNGKSIAYITDHAPFKELHKHQELEKFIHQCDLLIIDATFTPETFAQRPDWGHSSGQDALHLGEGAGAKQIALFHHDPDHTDQQLAEIESYAKCQHPHVFMARQGQKLILQ